MRRRLCMLLLLFAVLLSAGTSIAQQNEEPGPGPGQVSGALFTKEGAPMNGGLVYFFTRTGPLPDPERYWRVPDFMAEIGEKGEFSLELLEGEYYIGAIKRAAGKTENGPPEIGDLFYKGVDANGKPSSFIVKKGERTDLGAIRGAVPFKGLPAGNKISAIKGKVITPNGKPVKGALVFAFLTPSIMGKPAFASYRTGKDGTYVLRVDEGGSFFLRARDIYGGGPPVTGALIGNYGGETPQPVVVITGKMTKGINITVEKFKGRGRPSP